MLLDVAVLSPREIIFAGKAKSVILPAESGVFEVQAFHKRLLSRLVSGVIFVDEKNLRIRRGVALVDQNRVTVIVEASEGNNE